eukprot:1292771-Rhodomonas_salina.2
MSETDKKKLLKFVTGNDRSPIGGAQTLSSLRPCPFGCCEGLEGRGLGFAFRVWELGKTVDGEGRGLMVSS